MSTIMITGASQGFGRELLDQYRSHGWTVFAVVRRPGDVQQMLLRHPSNVYPIVGDVRDDSVESAITESLAAHTDSLDILINNAGNIKKEHGLLGASSDDLIDHFNVHCVGAWRCARAALPFLRNAAQPVIVNITSRKGSIERAAYAEGRLIYAYQIAKAAQNMLSACLDRELRPENIRVLSVHPGGMKTAVAPPDADTDPRQAARRLYDWLERFDRNSELKCLDLMTDGTVPW